MKNAVKEIMEEGGQCAVNMRMLAAGVAIIADQRRPAVEAVALIRMTVRGRLASIGLNRATKNAAGHRIADRFEFTHRLPLHAPHKPPRWRGSRGDASQRRYGAAHRSSWRQLQPGAPGAPPDEPGGDGGIGPR